MTEIDGLEEIMKEAIAKSVWPTPTVDEEPQVILDQWQVFESPVGRHFVGYVNRWQEGRVSSPILKFDESTMKGVSRSGKVYELIGNTGFSVDADYVLDRWLAMNDWTRDDIKMVTI